MDTKSEADRKNNGTKEEPSCRKISSAQKNEHLKALLKLKQQEFIIEKTISSHFENVRFDHKIYQDIQRENLNFLKERQKVFDSLRHSVDAVNESWKDVQNVIDDLSNFGNLDIEDYKIKLHNLWQKIQDYHKNEFEESLKEEQSSLDSELIEFNSTLHRYENCRDFTGSLLLSKNPYRINYTEKDSQDFEEVQNFSSLVAKTGHTQLWSDEDHLLFLKLRKKHKTIPALVNAMQTKCPDLSAKCIVNHEAWYKFYLKLREQQKKAVKDWRKQKDFERSIRVEKDESNIQDNFNETKRSGKIKETLAKENIDKSRISNIENNDADKKKELIRKWKEEKENKRLMNEEEAKLRKQSKKSSENYRKARTERLKNAVAEYKKIKVSEVAKTTSNHSLKENILKSADLIKSFREQDKYYIEKRKQILSSKKENDSKEIKREEKLVPTKPRISTLLKCTKVWKAKCKINRLEEQSQKLVYIKDLPKMSNIERRNQESFKK